jgi:hypothetical protein
MRFLGLGLAHRVPDANTIWTFREAPTRATLRRRPAIKVLFGASSSHDSGKLPSRWVARSSTPGNAMRGEGPVPGERTTLYRRSQSAMPATV